MPIIFALIAYFAWGSGDIFGTVATRRLGAYPTAFWSYTLRILLFALYIPFAIQDFAHYTPTLFALNLFLGIILLGGFLAFNQGLRVANPSIVGTIAGAFAAIVVVLSVIFLGDKISIVQGIFIAIIFLGVILTSLDFQAMKLKNLRQSGVLLALVAMVAWGIYFTFVKVIIREVGWFWPNYVSFSLVLLLFIFNKIKRISLPNPIAKKAFWPLILTVLLTGGAEFCFNYAVQHGYSSIVAPISGAYPTLFVLLSYFVFKEPLSRQQKAGIIVALVGITFLSILTS